MTTKSKQAYEQMVQQHRTPEEVDEAKRLQREIDPNNPDDLVYLESEGVLPWFRIGGC